MRGSLGFNFPCTDPPIANRLLIKRLVALAFDVSFGVLLTDKVLAMVLNLSWQCRRVLFLDHWFWFSAIVTFFLIDISQ